MTSFILDERGDPVALEEAGHSTGSPRAFSAWPAGAAVGSIVRHAGMPVVTRRG
jgi:hypothetical protein